AEVAMLAYTGMRPCELYGLRREDVHWEEGRVYVQRSASKGRLNDSGKTGFGRDIYVHDVALQAMKAHVQGMMSSGHPGLVSGLVFPKADGGPRDANTLLKPLRRASLAIGLGWNVRSVTFRRTIVTWLKRGGVDPVVRRAQTGHRTDAVEEWYEYAGFDAQKEALRTLFGA
ncbi:MAG: site-specific integrase, partial [Myxococcota bacterium]